MDQNKNSSQDSPGKGTSSVSRIINAPRKHVYNAFTDPGLVAKWLAPDNMRGEVHEFDAREGGRFKMSLIYIDPKQGGGKTSDDRDSFQGRFAELVPDKKIVELVEFESRDPRFAGEMKMTVELTDSGQGTEVTLLFQNIPEGINPADNDEGSRQSLQKLARLLEE